MMALTQHYVLSTPAKTYEFDGEEIGSRNTGHYADPHHWTVMTVYSNVNGGYVLAITGFSNLYHRLDAPGPCKGKGVATPVEDLPDDEEVYGCDRCGASLPGPGGQVMFEEDRPRVWPCADAAAVVDMLERSARRGTGGLSVPAVALLLECAANDPAFQPENRVVRL